LCPRALLEVVEALNSAQELIKVEMLSPITHVLAIASHLAAARLTSGTIG
jgi:hypothetical protein